MRAAPFCLCLLSSFRRDFTFFLLEVERFTAPSNELSSSPRFQSFEGTPFPAFPLFPGMILKGDGRPSSSSPLTALLRPAQVF